MPLYRATIEFHENDIGISEVKKALKNAMEVSHGTIDIKEIERISITANEAIREIKKLIDDEATYGCADASKIQSILEKVI